MFDVSNWDIRNLLQGQSLALLLLYIGALLAVGALHIAFRGSVVV
jgi:hypothetical protein